MFIRLFLIGALILFLIIIMLFMDYMITNSFIEEEKSTYLKVGNYVIIIMIGCLFISLMNDISFIEKIENKEENNKRISFIIDERINMLNNIKGNEF